MAEVKSGYLHKCGNTVKNWKRRWFVLKSNGYLYYYEDKSCKSEKGKIDVVDAVKVGEWKEISTVNKKIPSGFNSSNAFGIVTGDRTYTCICENDGEAQGWILAINKVQNAEVDGVQEYPEPTYPKEQQAQDLPVKPKLDIPLTSSKPEAPPAYSSDNNYGGSLHRHSHISTSPPEDTPMSNTLPRPQKPRPVSAMPALPATNPYYTPEVKNKLTSAAAPPPYQQAQPQHQPPQPQYRPPPQPQYRPPPQPQYRPPPQQYRPPPQPQYRPPPQPQYCPPPQAQYRPPPQAQYRPPPQAQYRPPPQAQYRPPPQAQYGPPVRGPYPSYAQPPPPVRYAQPPPPVVRQTQKTTVTVINVPATQQVVYRR